MSSIIAGRNCSWHLFDGAFMRLETYMPFDQGPGGAKKMMGAWALAVAEVPSPDAEPAQRLCTLPIENKSDYQSLTHAHFDSGIKNGTNELVLLYQHRRGLFGGGKPRFHIAAYPKGTWLQFFDAVANYKSQEFRWPKALFLYRPNSLVVFPGDANCFGAPIAA